MGQEPKKIERIFYTFQEAQEFLIISHQTIYELLRAGAAGCLRKTVSSEDLVQAIRSVRAGEFVSNAALMQRLLKHAARSEPVVLAYINPTYIVCISGCVVYCTIVFLRGEIGT